MSNNQHQPQTHRGRRSDTGKRCRLLFVTMVSLLLLATCGSTQPTPAPTAIVAAATSTPGAPTAAQPTDSPTLPPTPTDTSTPTPTLAPTETPSPVRPTETPEPSTATATPSATQILLLPTATPLPPARTPAPPTATVPPAPTAAPPAPKYPWRGQVVGTFSNCALTRLMGLTLDRNGGMAGGLWLYYWADGWEGAWAQSSWSVNEGYEGLDDSSNWDGILGTYAKPGTWHTCLVPAQGSRECLSPTVTAVTVAEPCAPDSGGVQIVRIVFQQN